MKYALNINAETNAVMSATFEKYAWEGCVLVDHLPDGDITDYDFVNGEYMLNEERKAARESRGHVKTTADAYEESITG